MRAVELIFMFLEIDNGDAYDVDVIGVVTALTPHRSGDDVKYF